MTETSKGVSLRDYVDVRFEAIEKATKIAMDASNYRLEGMNEFRHQLEEQKATFITRNEINLINKDKRADIALVLSIGGFLIAAASFLLRF